MSKDRITIRFRDPRDLRALRDLADRNNIKLNKLVTKILIQAVELNSEDPNTWADYLESLDFLKN